MASRPAVFYTVPMVLLFSVGSTLSKAQIAPPTPDYSQTSQSQAPTLPIRDPQAIALLQKSI
jgi:hypothetical protein